MTACQTATAIPRNPAFPKPARLLADSSRRTVSSPHHYPEDSMAKKKEAPKTKNSSVYKVIELVGISNTSWADAAKSAIASASKSLRDLRVAEVS